MSAPPTEHSPQSLHATPPATFVERGTVFVSFAYDIGMAIDLEEASRHIGTTRETLRLQHRTPHHFNYRPPPLRIRQPAPPLELAGHRSAAEVDHVVYDFGAAAITYRIPIHGSFGSLVELSERLYENDDLLRDSREKVAALLAAIEPAVKRAHLAELVEDFVVWQVESFTPAAPLEQWVERHAAVIAQILRAETRALSRQEIADSLAVRIAYTEDEMTVIDWNGALCLQQEADDVRSVLEFANVELLELRFLDDRLDGVLERSYEALPRKRRGAPLLRPLDADLRRIAELQMDSALLFEAVNNTLKLLGDQYLARVYRLASQRLHLSEWDASILRKLETVESIYEKLHDRQTTRRMEILEWIIIVLIAVSIVLPFL